MFGIGKNITVMFGNVLWLGFLWFPIPLQILSAEMSSDAVWAARQCMMWGVSFQTIEALGIKQLIDKPHKNLNSSPLFAWIHEIYV